MPAAPIPLNEDQRLAALERYQILDTVPEASFEDVVQVAAGICQTPVSLVSLVARQRQWFKAKVGSDLTEVPREVSFCAHTLNAESPLLIVPDTQTDPRFSDNPLVNNDPHIRFYAGASLITPDGFRLGTLCILDQQPRELSDIQQKALIALSHQIMGILELRLKNRELEQLNQFKNRLLSALSHDLRGSLTQMQSLLVIGDSRPLQPHEIQPLLQRLQLSFDASNELLHLLLRWAQSQQHGPQIRPQRVRLHPLLIHLLAPIQRLVADKPLQLLAELPPDLAWDTDRDILLLVLRNLLSNALKHTHEGEIRITAEIVEQHLCLQIQDTGTGIPPERIKQLFQKPITEPPSNLRTLPGHGVGLLLCRDFIHSLGGELLVTSEVGTGTCFTLHLPALPSLN